MIEIQTKTGTTDEQSWVRKYRWRGVWACCANLRNNIIGLIKGEAQMKSSYACYILVATIFHRLSENVSWQSVCLTQKNPKASSCYSTCSISYCTWESAGRFSCSPPNTPLHLLSSLLHAAAPWSRAADQPLTSQPLNQPMNPWTQISEPAGHLHRPQPAHLASCDCRPNH